MAILDDGVFGLIFFSVNEEIETKKLDPSNLLARHRLKLFNTILCK
jgi:hypothetical protein